jgi:hypothetical protein
VSLALWRAGNLAEYESTFQAKRNRQIFNAMADLFRNAGIAYDLHAEFTILC